MKIAIIAAVLFSLYYVLTRFAPTLLLSISAPWLVGGAALLTWWLSAKVNVK
jgi:hypothetical protein